MSARAVPTRNAAWPIAIGLPLLLVVGIVSAWRPPFERWSAIGFLVASGAVLAAASTLRAQTGQLPRSGFHALVFLVPSWLVAGTFVPIYLFTPAIYARSWESHSLDVAVVVLCLVGGACALVLTPIAALRLHERFVEARRGDRVVRGAARVAVAVALVLSILALRVHARPAPDELLDRFATVAELHVDETVGIGDKPLLLHYRRQPDPDRTTTIENCIVEGSTPTFETNVERAEACPVLGIVRDPHGVYGGIRDFPAPASSLFRLADGAPVERLTIRSLPGWLGPPLGWTIALAIATAIALVLLALAELRRRRAAGASGTEGVHQGGGTITIPDVGTLRVDEAIGMPAGPVVVAHVVRTETGDDYRAGATIEMSGITPGTLESVRMQPLDAAFGLDCAALTAALLGVVPMLAAAAYGLLG